MAAKLGFSGDEHGNVLPVARLERRVAIDIHDRDREIHAQLRSQRLEHPAAEVTSGAAVQNKAWLAPARSGHAGPGLRASPGRANRGHFRP